MEWPEVCTGILILAGCIVIVAFFRDPNIFSMGEDNVFSHGVNVEQLKEILLFLSLFITCIAISIAGMPCGNDNFVNNMFLLDLIATPIYILGKYSDFITSNFLQNVFDVLQEKAVPVDNLLDLFLCIER